MSVDVLPTQAGTFGSSTTSLSVSTNNESGYSLYLATANGENTLASLNPDTTAEITAVNGGTSGVMATNFGNNTWGYYLGTEGVTDATAYKAVPTTNGDTAVIATDAPTETDTYNFAIGTKVDTSLPSGTYSNQVVVSVVANPKYVNLGMLTYMQEMTSEVCEATEINESRQLIDERDNTSYWVHKSKDGNCWMTNNLRLSGGRTLTPDTSNVSSDWLFPNNSLDTSGQNYIGNTSTTAGYVVDSSWAGYYNFCAASAGTNCQNTVTYNATSDICPKGWRLPTSDELEGNSEDFVGGSMYNAAGIYQFGFADGQAFYGLWWSSTASSSDSQQALTLDWNGGSTSIGPISKGDGISIRCIHSH